MFGRPIIVEFLGLSGAGKSAVSHEVAARLRGRGFPIREPTRALTPGRRGRSTWQRALKSLHVARELVTHPLSSLRSLSYVSSTRQRRLSLVFRMGFNWLVVSSLMRTRRPWLHLLDQGVFQALWSIGLEARFGAIREPGRRLLAMLPAPDVVVVIEPGADVVADRLKL